MLNEKIFLNLFSTDCTKFITSGKYQLHRNMVILLLMCEDI